MSTLTATIQVGRPPPLGGGIRPAVVAHLYEGGIPRFLAYEVASEDGGPALERIDGAYAADFEADPPYPVTDLLLATRRQGSAITQRLDVLSEKARANYGRSFREMVFESDVEWGSDGYGRLFEARSQLEAHPFEDVVAVSLLPGVGDAAREAIETNLERLDATTHTMVDSDGR